MRLLVWFFLIFHVYKIFLLISLIDIYSAPRGTRVMVFGEFRLWRINQWNVFLTVKVLSSVSISHTPRSERVYHVKVIRRDYKEQWTILRDTIPTNSIMKIDKEQKQWAIGVKHPKAHIHVLCISYSKAENTIHWLTEDFIASFLTTQT